MPQQDTYITPPDFQRVEFTATDSRATAHALWETADLLEHTSAGYDFMNSRVPENTEESYACIIGWTCYLLGFPPGEHIADFKATLACYQGFYAWIGANVYEDFTIDREAAVKGLRAYVRANYPEFDGTPYYAPMET